MAPRAESLTWALTFDGDEDEDEPLKHAEAERPFTSPSPSPSPSMTTRSVQQPSLASRPPHLYLDRVEAGDRGLVGRLGAPSAARWVKLFAIALALPTLAIGFFTDDWFMVAALRRRWPEAPAWWDLYNFVPKVDGLESEISRGALPWWTAPTLRLHLVRPLASALLALDDRLFGDHVFFWHVHSLLWWVLLLLVVAALFRRIVPGATGTLALLIFAMVPGHMLPYAWPSSRHMLVGAVLALAGFLAQLRWREDDWKPGRWLGPLGLVVGLFASEGATGVAAFWLAYDLFGSTHESWRTRLERALPLVVTMAAYLVMYRAVGGGVAGNDAYVSPFALSFLGTVAERLPMLLGEALFAAPVELAFGGSSTPFVVSGVVAVVVAIALYRAARPRVDPNEARALRWLIPGAVIAVVGTCGGLPGGRALLVADLGFSLLLAVLLRRGWEQGRTSRFAKLGAWLLAAIHLGVAPLAVLAGELATAQMAREETRIATTLTEDVRPAKRVFVLAASDPLVSVYVTLTLLGQEKNDLDCVVRLDNTKGDFRVSRVGEKSIALESLGGPMLRGTWETLYRSRALAFHEGDEARVCGAKIRAANVVDGSPMRLEVTFDVPSDDPGLAMVAWDGERLARVRLKEGEQRVLEWKKGPMQTQ